MNDSSKVVSLTEKGVGGQGGSARKSMPLASAVVTLREKARSQLQEQFKQLFGKVDDSLFSMAERAHGQEEQDGLFQALRLLRVERRNITGRFGGNIDEAFQVQPQETDDEEAFASDNLSLVHNDDLEQLVAADSMVANAKRDFAEPITELGLRLDTLYSVKIYDKNNPLGPDAICDAFVEAIRPLDIHIRARLVLLKKFEQVVMLNLKDFYEQCNHLLVEQGVLPSLREQRRVARQRPVQRSAPGTSRPTTGAPRESGGAAAGPSVEQGVPQSMGPAGGQAAGSGNFSPGLLPATAGLAPMPAGDLLGHLGELQQNVDYPEGGDIQLLNVGSLLQQRLVESNQSASLTKVDSDIIKLVEMLFSFILEDRNLAEPIKSQLGRMQLPLLKVAIADKSFFSKGGHPARKLLNELADATTGWQAGEDYESDPLYSEVSQVVDQVLSEFDRDVDIFATLLERFRQFMARERKRAEMLERRVVDEADGRARTQAARARVAAVMDALIAERELPQVVQDWLHKVWNNKLFLTCVKEGTESDAWSRDVRTARDLVWSVQAPMPDSRQQLLALLPALQERLRAGVESVSLNPFEARGLFAGLKEIYRERFALAQKLAAEREQGAREQLEQEHRNAESAAESETATAETAEQSQEAVEEASLPQMEELEQAVAEAELAPQAEPEEEGLGEMPESDPHWQMTFRLAQGSWFELKRSDEEQFRCRLAAVIKDIDQFIFVNRNGAKVAEFSRLELAHALRGAQLMPLDDGMLFERALQSVIGNVRKKRGERS
ncbi:DUF1631 domain-containing protein [Microbulbifer halophilus]|uniref:DUF1631 domain-containing protein n=1 Tax=Microbulbifer halophilus TaxID=453963 RepID=A0ABW5EB49_9GAMM|nr:DUF1631 domain-containing protein [Microbulbifer halophilus]MCW8125258.1 DUF1631 domain-containing protein [Microbulbifer halophilus]